MRAPKVDILINDRSEVFASSKATSRAIRSELKRGSIRQIGPRLYTRNVTDPVEQVVRRNWAAIASIYFPKSVVVDRSHFLATPAADGSLFLDAGPELRSHRAIHLPGLTIKPRAGPGPVKGDMPYLNGLFFSSSARAFLDNIKPSRARQGVSRTLTDNELEMELLKVLDIRGENGLNDLRDQARALGPKLNREAEFSQLEALIGALQGSREASLVSHPARARGAGLGYDVRRIDLFAALHAELTRLEIERRPAEQEPHAAFAFFEAYLSNFIEGTEFRLEEAQDIVFRGKVPPTRMEDAHDILGTFELVNDRSTRSKVPQAPEELLTLLRSHHSKMLLRRPSARPGMFKDIPNRAGQTEFVAPELVVGTLREGFEYLKALEPGFRKAAFIMFLISEVHPFTDGNGRIARVMMNAELSASGEQRIMIPLSYRDNYLQALRALSRNGHPSPLIRVLDFAQEYASEIDWTTLETAERMLRETNALVEPDEAERESMLLRLPSRVRRQ